MERQFSPHTPVVKLPIHLPDTEVQNNKKSWMLLPNIVYKIMFPMKMEKGLNLFQETILKLLRTGYKSETAIAEKLHLGIDLVDHVLLELREMGFIDEQPNLTADGRKYLSEEETNVEMQIGYIFYDVLTKRYWDQIFIGDSLQYYKTEPKHSTIVLTQGTISRPWKQEAQMLRGDGMTVPQLKHEAVYQTMQASAKRFSDFPALKRRYAYNGSFQMKHDTQTEAKIISMGDPVYLPTFIYLPVDLKQNSHWKVCHPFGFTSEPVLTDLFNDMQHQNKALNERIDYLLKSALEVSLVDRVKEEDKVHYQYLVNIFGDQIERYQDVMNSLIQFVRRYKKVEDLHRSPDLGAIFEDLQTEYGSFMMQCVDTLEVALHAVFKKDRGRQNRRINKEVEEVDVRNFVNKDAFQNLKTFHTYAMKCGFEVSKSSSDYTQLLKLQRGEIIHAYDSKTLKGLTALGLLYSGERTDHVFRKIADKFPTLIEFLQEVLLLRNSFAHLTEDTYSTETTRDVYTKSLYVISLLFGLHFNQALVEQMEFDEASLMTDRKLRLLSRQQVEHEFGKLLEDESQIEKLLAEMYYFKHSHSNHFMIKTVSVIEQLLNRLLETESFLAEQHAIKETGMETLQMIAPTLQRIGFNFEVDKLSESFTKVNMGKVRMDLNILKRSVPNVKIYALLSLLYTRQEERWRSIAKTAPELFIVFIDLIDLRKHGHVVLTEDEMSKYETKIVEIVKVLVPYIQQVTV